MAPPDTKDVMRHPRSIALACALSIAFGSASRAEAAFPGKNGAIAYEHGRDIWTINPDGTGAVQLTATPGTFESDPAWSPDGKKIAFTSVLDAPGGNSQVWVMNADGSQAHPITTTGGGSPAWSPEGTRIAYVAGGSRFDVHMVDFDGTHDVNLTAHLDVTGVMQPSWSPDGTRLAVNATTPGYGMWGIAAFNLATRTLAPLAMTTTWNPGNPTWSPDGRTIALDAMNDGRGYLMNADGTNLHAAFGAAASEALASPAFSPDGNRLAWNFQGGEGAATWVVLSTPDGGNPAPLVRGLHPDWQPIPTGLKLFGTAAADTLHGAAGNDLLAGMGGNDVLLGRMGNDWLFGNAGNDVVLGGLGQDALFGGPGTDVLAAQDGASDLVDCGPGNDTAWVDASDTVTGCETTHGP
ncbi:MAG: TolB protein [Gaiellaceae bacterium]|nr:TolB protein [Gaiellaceae bacterium]